MSSTARSVELCIQCPPLQRIIVAHCTGVYVNSCLEVLTHCYCIPVHSNHRYFENTLLGWSTMQYNSSMWKRKFTEVSCIFHLMNLAYKSAAEVVLRILPAVNTQAASRTQNANVFNKDRHKHTVSASCRQCAFLFYLIWNVLANYMVDVQYMQNTLEYNTVASLDSRLAGNMDD